MYSYITSSNKASFSGVNIVVWFCVSLYILSLVLEIKSNHLTPSDPSHLLHQPNCIAHNHSSHSVKDITISHQDLITVGIVM